MSARRRFESSEEALLAFRHMGTPVEDADVTHDTRAQVVPAIACAVRAAPRQRARARLRRIGFAAAAAGLLLAGTQAYAWLSSRQASSPVAAVPRSAAAAELSFSSGRVFVSRRGNALGAVALARGLQPGDELSAVADTQATIAFSRGARARVAGEAKLVLARSDPAEERLRLALGGLSISVPKLGKGRAFVVETPQALVRVRGTRFTVDVLRRPGTGEITQVGVEEGAVEVLCAGVTRVLTRGERWSSALGAAERSPAPLVAPTVAEGFASPAHAGAAIAGASKAPARAASSTADVLAEQNQLMQAALRARARGDDRLAVRLLDELLTRHPSSPLAENAQVERFRALRRLGRSADAAREARRYLADHGDGFARDEAREMALEPESAGADAR